MNILNKVTLKTLALNKVRTLVTIVGIILSASMIAAVTTSVSSLQDFVLDIIISKEGDWHGAVFNINKAQLDDLSSDPEVKSFVSIRNIGYAMLKDCQNEYKPYLFIGGIGTDFTGMMPVNMIDGRMPENPSEIILPRHLRTNGGIKYSVGDTLTLDIGNRVYDGKSLGQLNGYLQGKDGNEGEVLEIIMRNTYTVVGIYERPGFESYSAPGYTALTVDDGAGESYDVYIKLKKPENIYNYLNDKFPENGLTTNNDLLRILGVSDNNSFTAVLYSLAAILIAIIMFGSISLIYNAFAISVSERTKQFGLLSSIGATRRQIIRCVLFEGFFLSLIGIPFGILAGIAGIGLTFRFIRGLLSAFLNTGDTVLDLSISPESIAAAIIVGLVTVLVSAYIPARRAVRISAIDAIRQSEDIRIRPGKLKTSKLAYVLLGFEGMIARKNFKRSRKKYRATVVSLFISVVLFVSASSFGAYLNKSSSSVFDESEYDIIYSYNPGNGKYDSPDELLSELSSVEGVTKAGYAYTVRCTVKISNELVSRDYREYFEKIGGKTPLDDWDIDASIYFIDDALYREYLNENSLDEDLYLKADRPAAVALDMVRLYNYKENKFYTFSLLSESSPDMSFGRIKEIEGYHYVQREIDENGAEYDIFENDGKERIKIPTAESIEYITLHAGAVTLSKPFCVDYNLNGITLLYPCSRLHEVLGAGGNALKSVVLYFKAPDHKSVFDKIYGVLEEKSMPLSGLFDYADLADSSRALISVISIFSYGFIILISLIAAANVFNTISTNIGLRRREFAMLKSIGLTQKGLNRMMNYECLLYGIKGLAYGITVSFFVTYLIYRSVSRGFETGFFIPWHSVTIAVGSVFAVVFATMLYSMGKIKKDNPIDALKNENA
ncbi:MAG: ABC transporter permease [Bacillota bacterium]